MKITSNVSNPSFTAQFKNNKVTAELIKDMNNNQAERFNKALVKLNKMDKKDVFEIEKQEGRFVDQDGVYNKKYSINNVNKELIPPSGPIGGVRFLNGSINNMYTIEQIVSTVEDLANGHYNDSMFVPKNKQSALDMLA